MAQTFKVAQLALSRQIVTASGGNNQLYVNGAEVTAGLSGNLTQTGVALSLAIANTGSQAWNAANGNGINLSGNATQTGIQLQSIVANTGSQAWNAANNNGINLSGNLTATGVTLFARDLAISGALAAQISSNAAGVSNLNGFSGSLTITSAGTNVFVTNSGTNGIYISGSGIAQSLDLAATGRNLYSIITGMSGQDVTNYATVANLTQTGLQIGIASGTLSSNITSLSGFTTNASGALQSLIGLTGQQAWSAANNNGINLSGNLTNSGIVLMNRDFLISGILATGIAQTGSSLYGLITAASGQANANYATMANLALTGSGLYTTITGMSGQFNTNLALTGSNLYAIIVGMSGQDVINYATKTQLTQSGVDLGAQIGALSGYTNLFLVHRTGAELISGSKTFVNNGAETFIVKSGAANILLVSGQATKMFLANGTQIFDSNQQVAWDSAAHVSVDWSTKYLGDISDVISLDWANRVANDSVGNPSVSWNAHTLAGTNGTTLNWATRTLTGEWQTNTTGVASGSIVNIWRLQDASGALAAQIAGGGSVVKVSGSAAIPTADFTGIGGTLVLYSGGKIFISGAAAGVGGGVPSVNGITSAVTIIGTGGFSVATIGSQIAFSGVNGVQADWVLFSNTGTISGENRFRWDTRMGTLELGDPQLNYPDNPLSIGGSGVYLQANIRNRSTKNDASADLVITSDIGSDLSGYLDIGINNSIYNQDAYSMGSSGDAYIYVNGGSLDIATSTTGDAVQFYIDGTQSQNLVAAINSTGLSLPSGKSVTFDKTQALITGIANMPIWGYVETGLRMVMTQPAIWNRDITFAGPATTTSQTLWGNTAANVGTLSTLSDQVFGRYTNVVSATPTGSAAGLGFTTNYYFRGSMLGRNGFFFTSQFGLADGTSPINAYVQSGARVFVGMTDQTSTVAVTANDPAGNRVGLSFVSASGGTQANRFDSGNWKLSIKNNTTEFTGNVCPMVFQTGFYRFSMYCKPYPDNNTIFWELNDIIRGSGCYGGITGSLLPLGATAMKGVASVCNHSGGARNIRVGNLYIEGGGSFY